MFCPKRGISNPDGARFCGGCGTSLPQTASAGQQGEATPAKPNRSKRPVIGGEGLWGM